MNYYNYFWQVQCTTCGKFYQPNDLFYQPNALGDETWPYTCPDCREVYNKTHTFPPLPDLSVKDEIKELRAEVKELKEILLDLEHDIHNRL